MESVTLALPAVMSLYIPRDYLQNGDDRESLRVLPGSNAAGIRIQWNDAYVEFIANTEGLSFRREAILGFWIDRFRWIMRLHLCALDVELSDCRLPVLMCGGDEQAQFNDFMSELAAAGETPVVVQGEFLPPKRYRK